MADAPDDYYALLGVGREASRDEIKSAYSRLLAEERARISTGAGDPAVLNRLRQAYDTLASPKLRAAYDASSPHSEPRAIAQDAWTHCAPQWSPDVHDRRETLLPPVQRRNRPPWKLFWLMLLPGWLIATFFSTLIGVFLALATALGTGGITPFLVALFLLGAIAAPVFLWRRSSTIHGTTLRFATRSLAGGMLLLPLVGAVATYQPISEVTSGVRAALSPAPRIPLLDAAYRGDAPAVRKLLARGADVDQRDPDRPNKGRTALHYAAGGSHYAKAGRHVEVARILRAHGADVNAKADGGYTPLHVAAGLGQLHMARWLLDNGANIDAEDVRGRPLKAAIAQGHEQVVALLIERKASLVGVLDVYDDIASYYPSHTAILRRLIDAGVDLNKLDQRGRSGLDYLRSRGEEPILLLLEGGANVAAGGQQQRFNRVAGYIRSGYTKVLDRLLNEGLDLGMRAENGDSLMHVAATSGEPMLEYLHVRDVPFDVANARGETPLHIASRAGNAAAVAWLVNKGASPQGTHRSGSSLQLVSDSDDKSGGEKPR